MPVPARLAVLERVLLWTLLGGWIGALLLFGTLVTRVAFTILPDPALAGRMVGHVLGPLQLAGMAIGIMLAALGGALGRGRLAIALPLLLAALCATNHFVVAPAVAGIHLTDPAIGPDAGVRFARLHQLSMVLFSATTIGALALVALHAVVEWREAGRAGR